MLGLSRDDGWRDDHSSPHPDPDDGRRGRRDGGAWWQHEPSFHFSWYHRDRHASYFVWIGYPWSYPDYYYSYPYYYYYPYYCYPYAEFYDYGPDYYYGPVRESVSVYQGQSYEGAGNQDLIFLGFQYFAQGRYLQAKNLFRRALTTQPRNAYARFAYAQALFALDQYPLAVEAIRHGLVLDPTWPESGLDVRTYYPDPSVFVAQLAQLEDYVAGHPDDADVRFLLAYNLYFSGEEARAQKEFTRLAEANPLDRGPELFLNQLEAEGVGGVTPSGVRPLNPAASVY